VTALRTKILRAMRAEVDCWMNGYFQAGAHISRALADGSLPIRAIEEYPRGSYPEHLSREIAHLAGLPYDDDPEEMATFGPYNVTSEHVSSIVDLIHDITIGRVSIEHMGFGFHEETLEHHRLTLSTVRRHMKGLSLLDAARLLSDAFDIPLDDAR
jgi:hypothetical protein